MYVQMVVCFLLSRRGELETRLCTAETLANTGQPPVVGAELA